MIGRYVLDLNEADETRVAVVGGKGAQLGALLRIDGVRVPAGFCVTTDAFRRVVAEAPSLGDRLDRLSRLRAEDREAIGTLSAEISRTVEGIPVPGALAAEITSALARLGEQAAYAVRPSATAEDLPTASFAGQLDTYLYVVGPAAVLRHGGRRWASLFTERAVTYRRRNGIDDRPVQMAVVVQRMVLPYAAGTLFTADPVTGDRMVATVDAGYGLGVVLVSGLVNPDVFTVRDGEIVTRAVAAKRRAVHAVPGGGTRETAVAPELRDRPALTDAQVVRLVRLGRRIEAHFGRPQDIEWCLTGDDFQIVQSRPITTLFPVPATGDAENHVYVSVGHQQMMTDPMRPLGLSMWRLTAMAPMHEAGGRLFVDVTRSLASPAGRARLLDLAGRSDPLMRDALETVLDGGFVPSLPDAGPGGPTAGGACAPIATAPAIVTGLIERSRASLADAIRPHPEVAAFLEGVEDEDFLDDLPKLAGGTEARDAIETYLDRYGMRCVGEIDIARPRWRERPTTLVPVILDNVRNFAPGAAERRFEQGRREARRKEEDVLSRLRDLPDGERKAVETKRMIDRVRTFIGYREYPKYNIVSRYFVYKQALLEEAGRLVLAGVLADREDVFYLIFEEFHEAVRSNQVDARLIRARKDAFRSYHALTPPRVLTSDGEALAGAYRRDDVPSGALVGLPVSAGFVVGWV